MANSDLWSIKQTSSPLELHKWESFSAQGPPKTKNNRNNLLIGLGWWQICKAQRARLHWRKKMYTLGKCNWGQILWKSRGNWDLRSEVTGTEVTSNWAEVTRTWTEVTGNWAVATVTEATGNRAEVIGTEVTGNRAEVNVTEVTGKRVEVTGVEVTGNRAEVTVSEVNGDRGHKKLSRDH